MYMCIAVMRVPLNISTKLYNDLFPVFICLFATWSVKSREINKPRRDTQRH